MVVRWNQCYEIFSMWLKLPISFKGSFLLPLYTDFTEHPSVVKISMVVASVRSISSNSSKQLKPQA